MLRSISPELWALNLVTFVSHLGWTVLSPVLPMIQAEFGLTATVVSLVPAVYGVSRLLAALPTGMLVDRIGHRVLLQAGCLMLLAGSVLGALSAGFEMLLVSRLVSGVGACFMIITNVVLVNHLSPPEQRGRSMGIYHASSQAGTAFSPVLAGLIAAWGGWRAPLWLSAATALATLAVIALQPGLGNEANPQHGGGAKEEQGAAPVGAHWISIVAAQFVTFALFFSASTYSSTYIPLVGEEQLGLDASALGLILGFGTALRFVTSVVGGQMSDRWGRRSLIVLGLVLTSVGMALSSTSLTLSGFLSGVFLLSLGRFGNGVPNSVLADHLPRHRWGSAMGFNRFLGDLGLVLGPTAVGLLLDSGGYRVAGLAMTLPVVVAALFSLVIRETVAGRGRSGH